MPTLPVAILAGGIATRLRPITERIPKALVEVAGRPFVDWQLEYLRGQGISRAVLCVGHLAEQIEQHVGNGAAFGLSVAYMHDGPNLMGTGGALQQALPLLGDSFFVLYGDSFLPIDFGKVQDAFEASGKPALMTVLLNENRWDVSNVEFRNGVLVEYNKREPNAEMRYIDYGLGVLKGTALREYPAGRAFDLADVYHRLSITDQLAGHEVFERFYEIGTPDGLKDADTYLRARRGDG